MISLRHKTVMLAAAWALSASSGCTPPVESEEAQAPDGDESDEVIGTAAEGISVTGMGHYCSMTWPGGIWGFEWDPAGNDPCNTLITQKGSGGTIQRSGVFSVAGVNSVVVTCNGGVGLWVGVGSAPLDWARTNAAGSTGCIFTPAPKWMPILNAPFAPSGVTHATGFDFAKWPYNTLNVQDFGQPGSTAATVVDWKGRDKSAGGFKDNHDAHDWLMPRGTELLATAPGVVRKARWFTTNCNYSDSPTQGEVYIDHFVNRSPSTYNERFTTAYFHLQDISVTDGQGVSAGTVIGHSGNTGCSDAPHLHFAVIRMSNTAFARIPTLTIDASGNDGWRMVIDPYGFDPPSGFDPWGWRGASMNVGALSIGLWNAGQAPVTTPW